MIQSKEIRLVKLKDVKVNPNNRNKHTDEQIDRLIKIIEYQGFRSPLIVSNRTGQLVAGHGRLLAAQKMKLKEVPVMHQDFTDEDQEYAAMVSDNAIASWSELDLSAINQDIGNLGPDFDIDLLGIKGFEIEVADKDLGDEDAIPENVEAQTKLGDIYQLGRHRLMCGDSASITDLDRLMAMQKPNMVYTDPPYGIDLDTDYSNRAGGGRTFKKIENDDKVFEAGFLVEYFAGAREIFLWGANNFCHTIDNYWKGNWVVWEKKHEEADTTRQGAFELCWSKVRHRACIARIRWLACDTDKSDKQTTRVHPTQKPVALAEWFFKKWGKPDDTVADLFGGSGSTLIACEKTNRNCFMMELDPHYCDVIVKRWENYTGKKAELIAKGD